MPNYLFLSYSKNILSKFVDLIQDYYTDNKDFITYDYNGNTIHINKFSDNQIEMTRIFNNILRLCKFDKIFILVGNIILPHFTLYIDMLSKNLVKSESDVIVFKIKSIESNFKYKINFFDELYFSFLTCKSYYSKTNKTIFFNIQSIDDLNYKPDYFINYLTNKKNINEAIIKSEKMIRDVNKSN